MSAGLAGAIAVICAQDDDLRTLETALLTRRLRADVRVVAQLTNPAVGRAIKEVGVAVLDVAGLSAPSVVEACLREGVQELSLSGERFLAARTIAARAGDPARAVRCARPRRGAAARRRGADLPRARHPGRGGR